MSAPSYTPEQRLRALNMIDRSFSVTVIAERTGISYRTIHKWRQAKPKRRAIDMTELLRRVQANETDEAIAAAMGWGQWAIRRARQRLGIKRKGADGVSRETRERLGRLSREHAMEERAALLLGDPEPKWRDLLGDDKPFKDAAQIEPSMAWRQPRIDISAGLGASSMSGWA